MLTLSVDDACASDVRVAELASKYKIKTVFYWPVEWHSLAYENGYEPLSYGDALQIAEVFEIGSHTITHRHLTRIPYGEAEQEILYSKWMIQDLFHQEVTKFCPPRGYTTPALTKYTLENYESQRLTKGEGLVHIHPESGANGLVHWLKCIDENTKELWCHSWELNKYPDLWGELEEVLSANLSSQQL